MAIIKAPPKQPKSVTVQARVEESVKTQLDQYAKFIDSTPSMRSSKSLKMNMLLLHVLPSPPSAKCRPVLETSGMLG